MSTEGQSLDQQRDALAAAGVPEDRVYSDKLSGKAGTERAGLDSLLDYARSGDTVVVVGIDRLGRSVAEVSATIANLAAQGIVLRSLREGVDPATAAGRMLVVGSSPTCPTMSRRYPSIAGSIAEPSQS
ncbi:recombinase family protein [Tsukamurella asaccharolytica]|uniref:Recombinase family protein n=1 Tax=Tsukamurella asaccharolytica TaxID=2592067 RepID=A0A5C5R9A7_9ACTN|nr:recombinase family protein [Tsukamurella asaccharolytica]